MSGRTVPRFALAGLLAAAFAGPAVTQEGVVPPNPTPAPRWYQNELPPRFQNAPPAAPMPRAGANTGGLEAKFDLYFQPTPPMSPPPLPGALDTAAPDAVQAHEGTRVHMGETRTGQFILSGAVNSDAAPTVNVPADRPCCDADCCRKPAAVPPMTAPTAPAPAGAAADNRIATPNLGPVGLALDFACPVVRSPADHKQLINFSVGVFGADPAPTPVAPCQMTGGAGPCRPAPVVIPACCPGPLPSGGTPRLQLVVEEEATCPPCPLPKTAPNPLLGTWYRDTGVSVTAATFTRDEMKLCLTSREGTKTVTFTVTAHYTVTKDGLVYGAVTGADVDAKLGSVNEAEELSELAATLQELTDRPFSFRAKMTSAGLMVSQLKVGAGEQIGNQELALLGGLYKFAKDGRVPAPTAMNRAEAVPVPTPAAPDLAALASPAPPTVCEPIQRIGVDFNFTAPPQGTSPGRRVSDVIAPATPPVCIDATKLMAADAFTQMMRGQGLWVKVGGSPPPVCTAQPVCSDATRSMAADAFTRMCGQGVGVMIGGPQPPVCGFDVVTIAAQPIGCCAPARPGPLGTWYREIGAKRCVVKVEPDHLTITLSEAHEMDGMTATGHLTITADYHTARDGLTVVGLITSVDAKFDGELPDGELESMPEKISDLQKALEDKPLALTFRRYGDALVIGNVRMPDVGDHMELQPAAYVGGRYKSVGDKPLPKLKVMKEGEMKPARVYVPPMPPGGFGYGPLPLPYGTPGPSGMNPWHAPPGVCTPPGAVYPPAVHAPSNDLLPPQAVPYPAPPRPVGYQVAPAPRPQVEVEAVPVVPTMSEPTPPAPMMPTPIPLAVEFGKPVAPGSAPKDSVRPDLNPNIIDFRSMVFPSQ